jgi:hypothetical protein
MQEHQPRPADARASCALEPPRPSAPSRRPLPRSPGNPAGRRRHYATAIRKLERAAGNRAYLHVLLLEKEPEFVAALELATNLIDRELSDERPQACTAAELRKRLASYVLSAT